MNHDAAMAIVHYDKKGPGKILWAAHSERYSKTKNDLYLNEAIVNEARKYGWQHHHKQFGIKIDEYV